jgi:hypothetical protein
VGDAYIEYAFISDVWQMVTCSFLEQFSNQNYTFTKLQQGLYARDIPDMLTRKTILIVEDTGKLLPTMDCKVFIYLQKASKALMEQLV